MWLPARAQRWRVKAFALDSVQRLVPDRWRSSQAGLWSFAAVVLVPTLCAALYFGLLATRQYEAETYFVIHGRVEKLLGTDRVAGMTGQLIGLNDTQEAHIVANYITSSAMLEKIGLHFDLARAFGSSDVDLVSRLPASAAQEKKLVFWRDHVDAHVDPTTGVTELHVRAFEPQDALTLSHLILIQGEDMANGLTSRVRSNALAMSIAAQQRADSEVSRIEHAEQDLRDLSGLVDPTAKAKDLADLVKELKEDRIKYGTQMRYMQMAAGGQSPLVSSLNGRLDAVTTAIDDVGHQMANAGPSRDESLSNSLLAFERLEASREIADERFLATGKRVLEARLQAARRNIYIEAYDPPAILPRKSGLAPLRDIFLGSVVFWGIAVLAVAGLRDFST